MPASPSAASPVTDHHPQAEPHTPPRARSPSPFVAPDYSTSLQPHSSFRLSPEHILKTSSNLSLSNHGTFSHSPPQDFNDSVDLDQSIVFPSNFLSPEEFLSVGQEIVQSYKHHLAFLTKKYDLQRMIIDELDASSGRKDGELATLRSKLGRLESRLMEPSTPSASQTLDLETRLEMERAELEAVHEELKDEKARREALEKRVEEIEGVQGRLGVADETGPGKPDGVLGGLAEDVLERDLAGRLFGEKKPILEDIPTGVSNESISTGPSKQSTSSDHTALQPLVVALASARRTIISLTSDLQTTSRQAQANQHALQLTQSELDNQWKRADQHHDDIQRLQTHREQLLESLRRSDAEVVGLEKTVDEIKGERDELAVELEEMKDQVGIILREKEQTLRESGAEALDKANEEKEELEREVGTLRSAVEALTKERLDLVEELEQIQGVGLEKDVEIDSLKKRTDELSESVQAAVQENAELTSHYSLQTEELDRLRTANTELRHAQDDHLGKSRERQSQIDFYEETTRSLSAELASSNHALSDLQRQLEETEAASSRAVANANAACEAAREDRDRTVRRMKLQMDERSTGSAELERLGELVTRLKEGDAAKEVRISRLLKSKAELKEVMETLEIALDSKQQELEMVKRKFGVRGVAGSIAAPERTQTITNRRRTSEAFTSDNGPSPHHSRSSASHSTLFTSTTRTSRPRSSIIPMDTPGPRRPAAGVSLSNSALSPSANLAIPRRIPSFTPTPGKTRISLSTTLEPA